jgi:hypothetical protein
MKKPRTAKLTNAKLDEMYKRLCEAGAEPKYGPDGKPVYSFMFYGTEEELEKTKKKLSEL